VRTRPPATDGPEPLGSPEADADPADTSDQRRLLGHRLRGLRSRRGLTIAEVATATKMSRSFLALLERGGTEVAVSRLMRLADFYGVWLGDLLGLPSPVIEVVPAAHARRMLSNAAGVDLRVLTMSSASSIQPFVLRMQPGSEHRGLPHQGQLQFTHCLSGSVTLEVAEGTYPLTPGDTIYFPSRFAHVYRNPGPLEAVVVGAVVRSVG
jgi:transcriptional regulator with XRE-family HTH domain